VNGRDRRPGARARLAALAGDLGTGGMLGLAAWLLCVAAAMAVVLAGIAWLLIHGAQQWTP
jgi:uncharacterized membrane protein (Fun14 family)